MSGPGERKLFAAAALALWALYVVQALLSPVLLDDWFQIRYWRDHELGLEALWAYARHNYEHYNPRIGEVFLAAVHGSPVIHAIVTPLMQVALLPIVFAIAFARWPRPTLRDLQLLLFVQVMIWLVIPIPGVLYFYRPYTTNYLFGFAITLALFVPYRLVRNPDTTVRHPDEIGQTTRTGVEGTASFRQLESPVVRDRARWWLAPIMLVLGWTAGMCNEHTGPTALAAMVAFVGVAWRRRRLRAWMVAGMIGLGVGYAMLMFAPGQSVRYGGFAAHTSPLDTLAARGVLGCAEVIVDFVRGAALGLLLSAGALASYVLSTGRRGLHVPPPRAALVLAAAAFAVVVTLFASPTTSDRVFFAPGVLLVAALAVWIAHVFEAADVRRLVVGACVVLAGYHAVRFVHTSVELAAACRDRMARLEAAPPGSVPVVPSYAHAGRTRWHLGDDLAMYPWLRDYVGGQLYDLAGVDLDRPRATPAARVVPEGSPTYRRVQAGAVATGDVRLVDLAFADPRPLFVVAEGRFVDGRPHDEARGHFVRVRRATLPSGPLSLFVVGCAAARAVEAIDDGDAILVPVDERHCRGPFTALACERERCWVAGWY